MEDLGTAKKVVIDKDTSTLVEGGGKRQDIESRVKQIRKQGPKIQLQIMIAKSCKNVWPNLLAA